MIKVADSNDQWYIYTLLMSFGFATKINASGRRLDHWVYYTSTWSFTLLVGRLVMAADVLHFLHCYVEYFLFATLHVLTTNMLHLHVQ